MTANPARGEASIQVGGADLVLRPTFVGLVAAEAELGPLFALVKRAASGGLALGVARRGLDAIVRRARSLSGLTNHRRRIGGLGVQALFFVHTAMMRAADIASGASSASFAVTQVGAACVSPPSTLTLSLI